MGEYKNTVADFWARVDKTSSPNGCWLWTGTLTDNGYGRACFHDKVWRAHRLAYFLEYHYLPDELYVCHNCPGGDNKRCVNPTHLFLGTGIANMRDAAEKGMFQKGEEAHASKLKEQDVRDIRCLLAAGVVEREIATRFGVSRSSINQIKHGLTWAHVL